MGRFALSPAEDGRIKAAQIVGNARMGGVVSCVMNYYSHMDRSRYRFDFFTYGPSALDERLKELDPAARVFTIPPFDGAFWKAVPALKKLLQSGGYAIAHSHLTTLSAFALRAAKSAGVPVRICHAHSTFDRQSDHYIVKKILQPFAAKCATDIAACGEYAAENLYGKRADGAFILRNAIELNRFSYDADAKRKLGLKGKIFLFVGRFVPQKNLFFLLEAFARARAKSNHVPLKLALMGDGPQREGLAARAEALQISEDVLWVPPGDPALWYSAADAFCLPSLYEGFPVVGVEAQASGLFCLFSDKIAREADVCGNGSFLPLDADVWAEALLQAHARAGNAAEKLRSAGFDIGREADRLTAFYDRTLKKAGIALQYRGE